MEYIFSRKILLPEVFNAKIPHFKLFLQGEYLFLEGSTYLLVNKYLGSSYFPVNNYQGVLFPSSTSTVTPVRLWSPVMCRDEFSAILAKLMCKRVEVVEKRYRNSLPLRLQSCDIVKGRERKRRQKKKFEMQKIAIAFCYHAAITYCLFQYF